MYFYEHFELTQHQCKIFPKEKPPNFIGSELDAHQNVEWGLQLIPTHYHSDYDILEIDLI